jgi:type IV pilus assembly protein PilO
MNLNDFKNLDPNNIGNWPVAAKAIVIILLCAAVLGAGYWFDTQDQIAALKKVESEEQTLRNTFEAKQKKSANLEPLKRQLAEMKQSFGALLRLLPNKTEIEALLVDISQSGLASGLEFELFKPRAEIPQDFYAIQPIQIRVAGTYHEFGEFISAVAALPRIVTQHNIHIRPRDKRGSGSDLLMDMVAKTYRYLEDDEMRPKKPKRKGRR